MLKIQKRIIILLSIFFSIFFGCTNINRLIYFQNIKNQSDTFAVEKAYVPKVHSGDILSIYVNSLSPEASSFFNPYSGTAAASQTQSSLQGYLVDSAGVIQLPLVGNVKVEGFSTSEVRDTIKSLLKSYLKEPTVLVRFLNFKITILGEVVHPAIYNIPNERVTLPEAISMAGDLTIFAKRDSIQIIREIDGKKVITYINFKNRDFFNSPYYYLHANDLIYIKPTKAKVQQLNDHIVSYISIGLSVISVLFIVFKL